MSYCREHGTNNCPECTTEAVREQTKVLKEIRDLLKPRPWIGARLLAKIRKTHLTKIKRKDANAINKSAGALGTGEFSA